MDHTVKIDVIDIKILRELTEDARTRLKDIAKDCGLSLAAVSNRVKRLKATGIIAGSIQFTDLSRLGVFYPATIGVSLDLGQEARVLNSIKDRVDVVFVNEGVGKDNLLLFVVAHSLQELDNLKQTIRKHPGVRRVSVHNAGRIPYFSLENIDLQPMEV